MSSETSRVEEEVVVPKQRKPADLWCAFFWLTIIGLMFLGLGVYYEIAHCSKFQGWPNVNCNTTSFRLDNIPYVGVRGFVTVEYSNGRCNTSEFQLFECTNLGQLANCLDVNQLNYNSGKTWPCYLPSATECGGQNDYPQLNGPSKESMLECKLRIAFFTIGGYFSGPLVFVILWGLVSGARWCCDNKKNS